MGTSFILALWLLGLVSLTMIVGLDLPAGVPGRGQRVRLGAWMLVADALMLIGAGLGTTYGLQLAEEAPRLDGVLQGLLPLLCTLLGGWLAARWFITGRTPDTASVGHRPAGVLALLLALVLVFVTGGVAGVVMDSIAILVLAFTWLLVPRLGARGTQALRLSAALILLWSGAFLVYLRIFPAEVTVETIVQEGATTEAAPGQSFLWVAPVVFAAAFLLGFIKRQRG